MAESAEAARVRQLYDLGCAFAAKTDLGELIPFIIKRCREALNAEAASVLLLNPERTELYFPYVSDDDARAAERLLQLRLPADRGIAGAALTEGHSILVEDAQHDPRFYPQIDRETKMVTRSIITVPLIIGTSPQGAFGVLQVLNRRDGGFFNNDDRAFLESIAGSVAIAIENARLYSQLRDSEASLRTQVSVLRRDLARNTLFTEMIGSGPAMEEVFRLMESAATSMITVMIQGETGTGKELVARGIYQASARSEAPFIAVNCAAVPENLLESELFGHRRGSFTGAVRDSPGVFRAATGGVVFLDEVSEMPTRMQAKLLRVLEQEEIFPVGESFPVKVDVRVLSATNRDLEDEVRRGNFREDLYWRLSAFPIHLPPLRERREDIPLLVSRFITLYAGRLHKKIPGIETPALDLMVQFDWQGNIRQLRNEVERAVALSRDGDPLRIEHLSQLLRGIQPRPSVPLSRNVQQPSLIPPTAAGDSPPAPTSATEAVVPLRAYRHGKEKHYIAEVLARFHGNVSRAAQALEISRPALQEKMKNYGLR
ncbi:MAG TPA: sigma-54-dependent Fis family transcriptional regulator [Candidatus Binataceae bacterium]|nr:sigma-54-dependent Fis family transcriptional regulator [Candidatus Binataceae bacterium]